MQKLFIRVIALISIVLAGCSPALGANITPTPEQFLRLIAAWIQLCYQCPQANPRTIPESNRIA